MCIIWNHWKKENSPKTTQENTAFLTASFKKTQTLSLCTIRETVALKLSP